MLGPLDVTCLICLQVATAAAETLRLAKQLGTVRLFAGSEMERRCGKAIDIH